MRSKSLAIAGSVAVATAALTASVTPPAATTARHLEVALAAYPTPVSCDSFGSQCYVQPAWGVGVLGGLLTPLVNALDANPVANTLLEFTGWEFLGGLGPTTKRIYDEINALDYYPSGGPDAQCGGADQDSCRAGFLFATGIGTLGASDTVHALIESAQGDTRAGFDELKPAADAGLTNVGVIYINNMLRPDGGIAARFPDLVRLFGLNPAMPQTGEVGADAAGSSVWSSFADFTWPYNTLADFPITANPLSLANSLFAAIPPPELIGQVSELDLESVLRGTAGTASGNYFGSFIGPLSLPPTSQAYLTSVGYGYSLQAASAITASIASRVGYPLQGTYNMLGAVRPQLPILYPNDVLPFLVNQALKAVNSPYLLGNPINDVLAPAMKILVNIGYDDIVTPDKLDTTFPGSEEQGPYTYADLGYTAYDRTFFQNTPTEPTPFAWFNNPALTAEQTTAAYGDAWNAFTDAVKAQTEKPLWGILVPNPDNPPAASTASVAPPAAAAPDDTVDDVVSEDETAQLDADVQVADVSAEPAADKAEAPSKSAQSAGQDDGGPGRQARHGRGSD